ncbi:leukocyte receptor cluster member 1 homolog [Vanessa atalanta]|uniref:leukocyte receptor cluster member 1 homolog n=1 Tax=Vanessa atalanta TaxID=42275 RepID=UPI001FCD4B60|nr:leukocyte receptor cluster member 1 homolog [Vanessa atalanta]
MNILPKKRWHVRTKENIARVRKDEAEAAEKERQEQLRIENANREARINVLKQKSKQKLLEFDIQPQTVDQVTATPEHINLFANLEHAIQTTNKDHDKEIKEKNEEYEKKIGYLTYLGQDTNEALGKKNWYNVVPESTRYSRSSDIKDTYEKLTLKDKDGKIKEKVTDEKDGEIAWSAKQRLDPMNSFKSFCHNSKSLEKLKKKIDKNKNHNKSKHKDKKDDSKIKLQKLREARLKREQQEKYRTQMFLSKLSGTAPEKEKEDKIPKIKPKYNSQFNPEIARQNYK